MKKFALIFGVLLILVLSGCVKDKNPNTEEFVNPLFNKPLEPLSNMSTMTYLTPTSIKIMSYYDKNEVAMTGQCKLLENRKDFIKMLCNTSWPMYSDTRPSEDIYIYKIKGMFANICPMVEEITYEPEIGSKYQSTAPYCISPSGLQSEDD